ncbi:MAG: hypothetical protein K6G22_05505 [Lachnospiraceae bacterium]|nr:hypothetical protein [Lachnospiraceae bacterium]
MSDMILCHHALAKNPYFFVPFGVNIYSIEELCYLLANDAYLIDEDVKDEKLCDFLIKEAGMPELGHRLKHMLHDGSSAGEFVTEILESYPYLTDAELRNVRQILVDNAGMDKGRKHKIRGDNMLRAGRYMHALEEYRYILESLDKNAADPADDLKRTGDDELYAKILHNMGTAYARLFFLDRASECYFEAYEISHDRSSLVGYLTAMRVLLKKDQYDRLVLRHGFDDDVVDEVEKNVSRYSEPDESSERAERLREIREKKDQGKVTEYYRLIDRTLDEWKQEYKRSMMISK